MIDDYRSEGWTEPPSVTKGKSINWGDDVIPQVKQILVNRFHMSTAIEVVELLEGNDYMVIEKRWHFEH